MPNRPLQACAEPRCPNLVRRGRCPDHGQEIAASSRSSRRSRGYGPEWPAIEADYLARHPTCERCERRPAVMVDHINPVRGGRPDHSDGNLQSMCRPCHGAKSSLEGEGYPHGA